MGIFKSKTEKELDDIIRRLEMNMSNNYKDNAQSNLKELEEKMALLRENSAVKPKVLSKYEAILADYREKMQGFSHKDQKPYWH